MTDLKSAQESYTESRVKHWNRVATKSDTWRGWSGYYHRRLSDVYSFVIPPGLKVLEIGCGQGNLLAAVQPATGVGIDFSEEMIQRGKKKHPELEFILADAHEFSIDDKFDAVIVSDLVNDLWDVQETLKRISRVLHRRSRLVINTYSRLWEIPLTIASKSGLSTPRLPQNWLTVSDLFGLLNLANFETIRSWEEIIWPVRTPLLDAFFNRFLVKNWPFHFLALTNFILARPVPERAVIETKASVSVIVPARNEEGNIASLLQRVPEMGRGTELIFVEGHSKDQTYTAIENGIAQSNRSCALIRQTGEGKGDAVRTGFARATGEILIILDADLTVPPEDLPRFVDVLVNGKGEFVNGVRLVYPMEKQAMRFLNFAGNKFFSLAFSWLLGQPIKDTLCGTKALWRSDYELLASNRGTFGDFDPFGDFDLLFGAAKLGLKITEIPIRYRERTYGTTNIQRWKHGWLLIKMASFAAWRIKYV